MNNKKLPVTILAGFLGSGKTTLLQRTLKQAPSPQRIAVMENELGQVPVDDAILAADNPGRLDTILGRSCCEARAAFVENLQKIALVHQEFDRLIIEATGVAHPGMLAHALLADPLLKSRLELDGIVTVVDAEHFQEHAGQDGHATEQVAYADAVLVNKSDLVTPSKLDEVIAELRQINATARYFTTQNADVPLPEILNLGGFDLTKVQNGVGGCQGSKGSVQKHERHEIETLAFHADVDYDYELFRDWMVSFIAENGINVFRAKGVIALAGQQQRLVFQGVHGRIDGGLAAPWGQEKRSSKLIFIGRQLDQNAIASGLARCAKT
jgi:G3E family GTPase